MIKRFRNLEVNRRVGASEFARQTATRLDSEGSRTVASSRRESVLQPSVSYTRRREWQTIALWAFVVFSFAALGFVLYAIGAKCGGQSPL